MKFFYNKLSWLIERYRLLIAELEARNFHLDKALYTSIIAEAEALELKHVHQLVRHWQPSPEEIYLNMQRLTERHFLRLTERGISHD